MTDTAGETWPPKSSVARFGVALVGPRFVWAWLEPVAEGSLDLQVVEKEYRAHPGLSFEEYLNYTKHQALLTASATLAQADIATIVRKATEPGVTDEDRDRILEEVADNAAVGEAKRWQLIVDMVLMLVAPVDREDIRPHLLSGNGEDVRALKDHLTQVVIERIAPEVTTVAGVDPTSQPSSSG